jgi:hypothetical protein
VWVPRNMGHPPNPTHQPLLSTSPHHTPLSPTWHPMVPCPFGFGVLFFFFRAGDNT